MAIQYNGTTIGTLTLCQAKREKNSDGKYVEVKDKQGRTVYDKYPIQIRDGNCMAIFLYIHKIENPEDPKKCWQHSLQCFFVDESHMKRCLEDFKQGEAFEKMFYGKLKNIRLNIYYKQMQTLAKYMARDGLNVTCYYKEPKKK